MKKIEKGLLGFVNKVYNSISHPYTLVITVIIIAVWFILGFPLNFNDIWYKSLHLFEVLVTLILVFIIEITQKAEMKALQEKLDELIKKLPQTDNKKASIEKRYKGEDD